MSLACLENKKKIHIARMAYTTAGNSIANRHDWLNESPRPSCQTLYIKGIITCVSPPPRFPQPPAVALAVPTTFLLNMIEFQNWFTTKVEPKAETKKRTVMSPGPLVTNALQPTTTIPHRSSMQSVFFWPILSMTLPSKKRVRMSNDTAQTLAFVMVALQSPPFLQSHLVFWMSICTLSSLSQIPMSLRT